MLLKQLLHVQVQISVLLKQKLDQKSLWSKTWLVWQSSAYSIRLRQGSEHTSSPQTPLWAHEVGSGWANTVWDVCNLDHNAFSLNLNTSNVRASRYPWSPDRSVLLNIVTSKRLACITGTGIKFWLDPGPARESSRPDERGPRFAKPKILQVSSSQFHWGGHQSKQTDIAWTKIVKIT